LPRPHFLFLPAALAAHFAVAQHTNPTLQPQKELQLINPHETFRI